MGRVGGEIDGRQAAREEHLGIVLQRFLGGFALPPSAGSQQTGARQVEQRNLPAGTQLGDEVVIGEVAEEHQRRQHHDDAYPHQPVGAQAHFE